MLLRAAESQPVSAISSAKGSRFGTPPMPHEHGAWLMLYQPMLLAFAVSRPAGWAQVGLLFLAVTGAYLARHPADLLLRGKGDGGSLIWMGVYGFVAFAAAAPLLLVWHATALLIVASLAGVLFGVHVVLLRWPSARRLDRSVFGELVGTSGLALSAPAAVAVANGTLNSTAWLLWAACALFFGSGVFHVKMLLAGAKHKGAMDTAARRRIGRANVLYHAVVAVVALVLLRVGGVLPALAYLPIIVRALSGAARLSRHLPPLKRVGLMESAYAMWFCVVLGAAMLSR
jgi:hypothetical protein